MSISALPLPRRHRYSVTDYHRMAAAGILAPDARLELIDGEVFHMAPIGSRHASAVRKLGRAFQVGVGKAAVVSVQNPIRLSDSSEPQPDLALLRWRADDYADAHPRADEVLLVVEVADTTLEFDRDTKLPLYARHEISEVWLVDVVKQEVTRYFEPDRSGYRRRLILNGVVAPLQLPDCPIDLGALWQLAPL